MKTSRRYLCKASWRFLEDVLKTTSECIEDFLKMSWRRFYKTSWRRLGKASSRSLEDVLKTSSKRLEDVLKMSWRRFGKTSWRRLEDAWLRQIYYSWPKRLEDVFLRQRRKTSSRRLHQDMLAGVLSIREKHCHFISQLQTHFMDFLRLLLLI